MFGFTRRTAAATLACGATLGALALVPASATAIGASASATGDWQAPTALARPASVVQPDGTAPGPITRAFDSMTDSQRVGQLFMASLQSGASHSTVNTLISKDHIGGVILQGHWDSGLSQVRSATAALRSQVNIHTTRNVKLYIAGDQEGGYIQPFKGSGYSAIPSALEQGTHTPAWEESAAKKWGGQLATSGINVDLAPVADTVPPGTAADNPPIGALRRNFGFTTQTNSSHVSAFVAGMRSAHVTTAVKHFPGLGRVTGNTDDVAKVVDNATTTSSGYLKPFSAGISAHTRMVMVSLAYYAKIDHTQQAAFSHKIVTDLLRHQLGYSGVVISDSLAAASAETVSPSNRAIRFLEAGGDIMLQTDDSVITQMETSVLHQMAISPSFRNTVYASVKRVLTAKNAAGLLP